MNLIKGSLKNDTHSMMFKQQLNLTKAELIEKYRFSMSEDQCNAYDASLNIIDMVNEVDEG